ncbi:MAG: alkaline phosphatase family protein [Deltaproteobacteria bacterium]|nr:alkaline phosphatase family protein [Deltaproteobacteria bacterium]
MRWGLAPLSALLASFASRPVEATTRAAPRLAVVVVVDQLGASYIARYRHLLDGGIGSMIARGAYFPEGEHDYANTATGPGHATIATGAYPSEHGIVNNDWRDERTGAEVYCVGVRATEATPENLRAPTLADTLRLYTRGQARVVSLAIKDRAAVLSGGRRPTAVVFYDELIGSFVSGRYAEKTELPWLASFEVNARARHGRSWNRLRPDLDYEREAGPDDGPWETDVPGIGKTFPRVLGTGLDVADPLWSRAFRVTPDALDGLFELADRAIEAESLGRGPSTDLLFIGASSLDFAGHAFGPTSQEALDQLLRTDRRLGELEKKLDRLLGAGRTLWALTGDHGMADAPEAATLAGLPEERVSIDATSAALDAELAKLVRPGEAAPKVASLDPPQLYLQHVPNVDRPLARRAAARALAERRGVIEALAIDDLEKLSSTQKVWFERILHPGRRADVYLRTEPLVLFSWETGANHGSPHVHDMRVPIALKGPGVVRVVDPRPVSVTRIAPTLAILLGIPPPSSAHEAPLPIPGLEPSVRAGPRPVQKLAPRARPN